jgi:hypothetical protein
MFRCYLLRDGRIAKAENLDAATLGQAVTIARRLLQEQPHDRGLSGIEIWDGAAMLYSDTADLGETADPAETRDAATDGCVLSDAAGRGEAALAARPPQQSSTAFQH